MKNYRITVNGKTYDVTVEETGTQSAPVQQPSASAAVEQPKAAPVSVPSNAKAKVTAPMPGTVLKINVSNGQSVKKGDVLLVLEAMKMENEITSPEDGTVSSVSVAKGASVNSGDLLVVIA